MAKAYRLGHSYVVSELRRHSMRESIVKTVVSNFLECVSEFG